MATPRPLFLEAVEEARARLQALESAGTSASHTEQDVEAARREGVAMRDVGRKAGEDAIREMQKRGLTVAVLTDSERARWREEATRAYPGLRGPYCPAELYDDVMRFHAESRRPR